MASNDDAQTFLFTFRSNGEAHGEALVQVHVEQLADYDPSVADDAFKRDWFGTEKALEAMLYGLGFPPLDVVGVLGALGDHRDADRRLAVTPNQLRSAGFQKVA